MASHSSSSDSDESSSSERKRKREHHDKKSKRKREKKKEKKSKDKEKRKKDKKSKKREREGEGERSIITGKRIRRSAGDVADAEGELRRQALLAHMNEGEGARWERPKAGAAAGRQAGGRIRLP